jgi:methionyl-tRNA synthetase
MNALRVQESIEAIIDLLRRSNKYIDETTPWGLAKDPKDLPRLKTVIYNLCEAIRFAAVALTPYLPETSAKILDQLNTSERDLDSLNTFGNLTDGTKITAQPTILFQRLDINEVMEKINPKPAKLDLKPEITIDDFAKLDLRIGTVLSCENHPDSDKLLVSQVQIGPETRQIVSGLRPKFTPADLVGKQVVVVANLKPVKLRGVLSQGMLLVGEEGDALELLHFHQLKNGIVR